MNGNGIRLTGITIDRHTVGPAPVCELSCGGGGFTASGTGTVFSRRKDGGFVPAHIISPLGKEPRGRHNVKETERVW